MTHSLPPNPSEWPSSPYDILGISRAADDKEIRRAYTRLIRKYKPDFYPTEFGKVRAAYEAVRHATGQQRVLTIVGEGQGLTRSLPRRARKKDKPPTDVDLRELAETETLNGRYAQLLKHVERGNATTSTFVQLYWAVTLWPEIDESRSGCDWLAAGLQAAPGEPSLLTLYGRELAHREDEATSSRCTSNIRTAPATLALAPILQCRWSVACREGNWGLLTDDLNALHAQFGDSNPAFWFDLLVSAASNLAWHRSPEARQVSDELWKEIHVDWAFHMDRSDELDKFDILPSLIAAKDACANSHPLWKAIADALPVVWHKPFEESPQLTKLTKVIAADPEMALISLGRQRRDFGLCFHVLSETLETLMRDRVVPYDPGDAALASRVLESILRVGQNMSRLGREVSELCRQEGLTPTHVADIVEHDGGGSPGSQALSNQIREASVLRLVSLAVCMCGRS